MEEERLLPMVSREFSFYSFNNVNVMCYGATPSKSAFLCSGIGVVGSGQSNSTQSYRYWQRQAMARGQLDVYFKKTFNELNITVGSRWLSADKNCDTPVPTFSFWHDRQACFRCLLVRDKDVIHTCKKTQA